MSHRRIETNKRYFYILPALHFGACLVSLSGHLSPQFEELGIIWTFVMLIDLPISTIGYALAWNHEAVAMLWIVVFGTLWWYVLSRTAGTLIAKYRNPDEADR